MEISSFCPLISEWGPGPERGHHMPRVTQQARDPVRGLCLLAPFPARVPCSDMAGS